MPSEKENIPNIGPVSLEWLRAAGVETLDDLRAVGVVETYQRVKSAEPRATLNLLYSLEAALQGVHWTQLPRALRDTLKQQAME